MEAARRASIADDEARQLRAIEFAGGASKSRVTDGAVIVEKGTTKGSVDDEDTTEGV